MRVHAYNLDSASLPVFQSLLAGVFQPPGAKANSLSTAVLRLHAMQHCCCELEHDCLLQKDRFHTKWQYLYIESICNDPQVLEQNYRYKMMYSPDYKDVDTEMVSHLTSDSVRPVQ